MGFNPEEPDCGRCNDDPRGALVLTDSGDYREPCPDCARLSDVPRCGRNTDADDEEPF